MMLLLIGGMYSLDISPESYKKLYGTFSPHSSSALIPVNLYQDNITKMNAPKRCRSTSLTESLGSSIRALNERSFVSHCDTKYQEEEQGNASDDFEKSSFPSQSALAIKETEDRTSYMAAEFGHPFKDQVSLPYTRCEIYAYLCSFLSLCISLAFLCYLASNTDSEQHPRLHKLYFFTAVVNASLLASMFCAPFFRDSASEEYNYHPLQLNPPKQAITRNLANFV